MTRLAVRHVFATLLGVAATAHAQAERPIEPGFSPAPAVAIDAPAGFRAGRAGVFVHPTTGASVHAYAQPIPIGARAHFSVGTVGVEDDVVAGRPVRVLTWRRFVGAVLGTAVAIVPLDGLETLEPAVRPALRSLRATSPVRDLGCIPPTGWRVKRTDDALVLTRDAESFSISFPKNPFGPVAMGTHRDTALMWTTGPKGFGGLFDPRLSVLAECELRIGRREAYGVVYRHPIFTREDVALTAVVFGMGMLGESVFACIRATGPDTRRAELVARWHAWLPTIRFSSNRRVDRVVSRVRASVVAYRALAGRLPTSLDEVRRSRVFRDLAAVGYEPLGRSAFAVVHPRDDTSRVVTRMIRRREL